MEQKDRDYWHDTVNDTTKRWLSERLADVMDNEPNLDKLTKAVEEVMGQRIESSAETIARTETIGAYNAGADIVRQEAGIDRKRWLSTLDNRTRDAHAEADGQIVDADADFVVGGERLAYPGDPSGSVANIVNCRCVAISVLDDDEGRAAQSTETRVQMFDEFGQPAGVRVERGNPYHDKDGKFTSADKAVSVSGGMQSMFDRISKPDGGFTYHPTTGREPSEGYCLSIDPDRSKSMPVDKMTPADLVRYVKENQDLLARDDKYLGAWHDPKTGVVWLDVSTVVADKDVGTTLAINHNQIAIYDLKAGKSIETGGTGEAPK